MGDVLKYFYLEYLSQNYYYIKIYDMGPVYEINSIKPSLGAVARFLKSQEAMLLHHRCTTEVLV